MKFSSDQWKVYAGRSHCCGVLAAARQELVETGLVLLRPHSDTEVLDWEHQLDTVCKSREVLGTLDPQQTRGVQSGTAPQRVSGATG